MAKLTARAEVSYRNNLGQFARAVDRGIAEALNAMAEDGAAMSRRLAPRGTKHDERTLPLAQSITTEETSSRSASWGSSARHALAIERGARAHPIYGNPDLSFWWEEKGKWFVPGAEYYRQPGLVSVVNHPGNDAQPYLRPAYQAIWARKEEYFQRYCPN
jgi:hypothetical protein